MDYNSISIKPYIKSHLELQKEITLIELAPSPYFLSKVFVLHILPCLQGLMKIQQWLFKILRKQNVTDGHTHGRTHGRTLWKQYTHQKQSLRGYNYFNSFMHMFNVSTLYRQSIKLFHQKLWYELIGPWRHHQCIYKSHNRDKLSKFSQLSFCQKLFFLNQTPSCICSMCLHCIGKVSNCSIISCGRSWSARVWTIIA